jgi:hypothetical protein
MKAEIVVQYARVYVKFEVSTVVMLRFLVFCGMLRIVSSGTCLPMIMTMQHFLEITYEDLLSCLLHCITYQKTRIIKPMFSLQNR